MVRGISVRLARDEYRLRQIENLQVGGKLLAILQCDEIFDISNTVDG